QSLQDPQMSCAMSSSLYGGLHLYRPAEEEPTAAELLEATKRLYVKTDVLKDTKIDACTPRLFHSPPHETDHAAPRRPRVVAVKPSGSGYFRPSANSAFRPIVKEVVIDEVLAAVDDVHPEDDVHQDGTPPARPPKSTRIKQRARRLHQESICPISGQHRGSPPPLPPMRSTEPDRCSVGYELARRKSAPATEQARPVPAPRLSKLSSASSNSQPTPPPQPLPRRRTIQIDGSIIRFEDISKSSPDLAISPRLLSPNSSRHSPCLPSTVIRKRMAPSLVRPPTPLPAHEGVSVARDPRPTSSPHGHSSHGHGHGRRMTQTMLTLPSGSVPLSSPTSTGKATSKDSGVQPSDEEEDYRKHSSSLSEEVAVIVEDDDDSIFTSITNQPRREEVRREMKDQLAFDCMQTVPAPDVPTPLSSVLSRPLSVIEKHTRIITWIKSSATVPPEEDTTHHTTHHHNELTV
ncbi:hypothetical protein PENTCL1PPCAC_18538, partial [Pristionchus entomophagus]